MPINRENRHEPTRTQRKIGPRQQKILLLLLGGLALGCSGSPRTSWKIIGAIRKEWKDISRQNAERAINKLYQSRLLTAKENTNGTTTLLLTEDGKKYALTYHAKNIRIIKPKEWDKKWRMVLFDIPEDEREARDAFRVHLEHMGFYGLQKSASIHPFDCKKEIDFLIELHNIRSSVRFLIVEHIDNEEHLKKIFKLI